MRTTTTAADNTGVAGCNFYIQQNGASSVGSPETVVDVAGDNAVVAGGNFYIQDNGASSVGSPETVVGVAGDNASVAGGNFYIQQNGDGSVSSQKTVVGISGDNAGVAGCNFYINTMVPAQSAVQRQLSVSLVTTPVSPVAISTYNRMVAGQSEVQRQLFVSLVATPVSPVQFLHKQNGTGSVSSPQTAVDVAGDNTSGNFYINRMVPAQSEVQRQLSVSLVTTPVSPVAIST